MKEAISLELPTPSPFKSFVTCKKERTPHLSAFTFPNTHTHQETQTNNRMELDSFEHVPAQLPVNLKQDSLEHVENIKHHGIDPNSQMLKTTPLMIALSLFIGLGGFIVNFDIGYTGLVLVMPPFNESFGSCFIEKGARVCALTATQQSISTSIYLLFMALGGGMSGVSANYLGTRGSIQFGCVWVAIGAAGMLGSAGNLTAYVACKCIGGIGIGHLQTMSTTYGVECAPARKRGLLITLYSCGSGAGGFVVAAICLGTNSIRNSWSWRTPILLQIPAAAIYFALLFFFPESPRWLLTKEKTEQARKSFARLYNRNPSSDEVAMQVRDVQLALEEEALLSSTTNWTEIFHKNFVRRTFVSVAINVGGTLSGAFFIFTYAAIFLEGVGFTNSIEISVIINACLWAGLLIGPFVVEYLGRRRAIITGYCGMMVCMLIFSAVSTALGSKRRTVHDILITFLCLWSFMFGGFIASSQWLASAEMHAVRLRTSGQAFNIFVTNIFVFGTNFWTPYMLNVHYGNMGTNVGYFYFGIEFITVIIIFFILPENGRLTLEQIDDYFTSGRKPWKTSLARNKRIARGEIDIKDE